MNSLEKLQKVKNLNDLAKLLGYKPNRVSYILYKMSQVEKYRSFDIPKKSGGFRTINSPEPRLALLQTRLAELIYACVKDQKKVNSRFWSASHGFHKGFTIVSNAEVHKRKRFVFNIDLDNFFGSINFGRVRGFFIRDSMFSLDPRIATIIAQIACHNNALPQGSPCSPVISNLIGNILDSRLLALARNTRCIYTRYADDLTFSTNQKRFPTEIAETMNSINWTVGARLKKEIESTDFFVNLAKTRMDLRCSRQTVTGLVVNTKVNINQDYYRTTRSMCHSLFKTGSYFKLGDDPADVTENLKPLEGTLSHIYFVKERRDRNYNNKKSYKKKDESNTSKAFKDLYRKFLFYKHFAVPELPLILTEGITDIIYLQCAIKQLSKINKFPFLSREESGKVKLCVRFLKRSRTLSDILNLPYGTGSLNSFISNYKNQLKKYNHKPMAEPVIIICDNDDGSKTVFNYAGKKINSKITTKTTEPFYHLGENLYLVKVPEGNPAKKCEIEDLFPTALLKEKLNGKSFCKKKFNDDESHYGKVAFANSVVRPKADTIDFSGFKELLGRIESVIKYHKSPSPRKQGGTP